MKFEIKHRYSGAVLFALECGSLRVCVEAAVKAGANLADADLADADLAGADLAGADLADANLADAYLADAKNVPAGVEKVDPPEPYTRVVDPARYAQRAERYRAKHQDVPVVPDLDRRILEVIDSGKGALNMGAWHSCTTTHCRAGWSIHLAGEAGYALEERHGPALAGHMIYMASTGRTAHFFASNERALEDIRRRAGETCFVSSP